MPMEAEEEMRVEMEEMEEMEETEETEETELEMEVKEVQ